MVVPKRMAVFTDRDGVLIDLPSYGEKQEYIISQKEIHLLDVAIEGVRLLTRASIPVILVTNQPQVALGLCSVSTIEVINNRVVTLFRDKGAIITDTFYCPHHPTKGANPIYTKECECRKPKQGLLLQAAKKYALDLTQCFMIGDRISDIKAGESAGCFTIGVETGYACNDGYTDATPKLIVKNFLEAARYIYSRVKQ